MGVRRYGDLDFEFESLEEHGLDVVPEWGLDHPPQRYVFHLDETLQMIVVLSIGRLGTTVLVGWTLNTTLTEDSNLPCFHGGRLEVWATERPTLRSGATVESS